MYFYFIIFKKISKSDLSILKKGFSYWFLATLSYPPFLLESKMLKDWRTKQQTLYGRLRDMGV